MSMTIFIHLLPVIIMQNVGPHFERWNAGVLGPITLSGLNEGKRDLTWQKWSYKVFQTFSLLSLSHYCFSLIEIRLNACFRLVLKVKP